MRHGRVKRHETDILSKYSSSCFCFHEINNFPLLIKLSVYLPGFHHRYLLISCQFCYLGYDTYREGPVESWGICAYEADKSLRTVRSARLRYYIAVRYLQVIHGLFTTRWCRHQITVLAKDKFLWTLFQFILYNIY
jgi:hypothetical protein